MKTFALEREQIINAPIEEVWNFFSSPHNLKEITPAALQLRITNCPDVQEIFKGMKIDYTVKPLAGLKFKWITLIDEVSRPFFFSDTQIRGPYKYWRHEHSFVEVPEGVLMKDVVRYGLSFGPADTLINKLVVANRLKVIFDHRQTVVDRLFKGKEYERIG